MRQYRAHETIHITFAQIHRLAIVFAAQQAQQCPFLRKIGIAPVYRRTIDAQQRPTARPHARARFGLGKRPRDHVMRALSFNESFHALRMPYHVTGRRRTAVRGLGIVAAFHRKAEIGIAVHD